MSQPVPPQPISGSPGMRLRMHRVVVVLALAAVAFSGCSDDGPGSAAQGPEGGSVGLQVPTWEVGEAWSYDATGGMTFTHVVTAAGSSYTMDTDNVQLALFHARTPISMLGDIRASDLAGSQGSDRVLFFQWPLTDGANWTTVWDGATYTVTAEVTGDKATLTARDDAGTARVVYTYSNATGWFDSVVFNDPNGTEGFRMDLKEHTTDWTGEVVRVGAPTELYHSTYGGPIASSDTFDVPADPAVLWVDYSRTCSNGPGRVLVGLSAPSDDGSAQPLPPMGREPDWGDDASCPDAGDAVTAVTLPAKEGTWRADTLLAAADAATDLGVLRYPIETFPV